MHNRRNYYRVLQVQPGAPVPIIRVSYRTLMQRLRVHPDLGGDPAEAALVNEAYAVLTDPVRRAAYDRELATRMVRSRTEDEPAEQPPAAVTTRFLQCLFCQSVHPSASISEQASCNVCESPMRPAQPPAIGTSGRRAVARMPRHHPLTLYTTWPQPEGIAARSHDLSPLGVSFRAPQPMAPESIVKMDSPLCRAVLRVANLRHADIEGEWLIGAQFLTVHFPRVRGVFFAAEA
jgi:hypothetical protein